MTSPTRVDEVDEPIRGVDGAGVGIVDQRVKAERWYDCIEYKIAHCDEWTYPYEGIPFGFSNDAATRSTTANRRRVQPLDRSPERRRGDCLVGLFRSLGRR